MAGGHRVVVGELREYAAKLDGDSGVPTEVSGLVGQSDVGDRSWGVVGLFVKEKYTEMLDELRDSLTQMSTGLRAASEKVTGAANLYQQHEDDTVALLQQVMQELESPAPACTAPPEPGPAPR